MLCLNRECFVVWCFVRAIAVHCFMTVVHTAGAKPIMVFVGRLAMVAHTTG